MPTSGMFKMLKGIFALLILNMMYLPGLLFLLPMIIACRMNFKLTIFSLQSLLQKSIQLRSKNFKRVE